jgi:hypothetical protein
MPENYKSKSLSLGYPIFRSMEINKSKKYAKDSTGSSNCRVLIPKTDRYHENMISISYKPSNKNSQSSCFEKEGNMALINWNSRRSVSLSKGPYR